MDSGIYQLTFANGDTYIGKSLHLQIRYKQHSDKLSRGTAAKNMMRAYYQSDHEYPTAQVLVYCHPDVLDEYEGYWINVLKPTLNTQIPELRTEAEQLALIRHMEAGSAIYSVPVILIALENLQSKLNRATETVDKLEATIQEQECDYCELEGAWDSRAARDARAIEGYAQLEQERDWLHKKVQACTNEIENLKWFKTRVTRATWWQRLWRTW